jgi:hypothetical protein
VGDNSPDDWTEIKEMREQISNQTSSLEKYARSETKLVDEVKLLRNQLEEALNLKTKHESKAQELSQERDRLLLQNSIMKERHITDSTESTALTSENFELNE